MVYKVFKDWLKNFQQQALVVNERRLVVLMGDDLWAHSLLNSANVLAPAKSKERRCFIYGNNNVILPNFNAQRFRDKLGSESDYVIFADNKFNIDALAALSGTLVAGGVFFIIVKDDTLYEKSLFFRRFLTLVKHNAGHVVIEQNNVMLPVSKYRQETVQGAVGNDNTEAKKLPYQCVTQEQVSAVEAIIKVITGKRKKPLVLTADRGRGKSSALALACAYLLNTAKKDNRLALVITAADINALQVFFKQLEYSLPNGIWQKNEFITEYGSVKFIPVDQLIKQQVTASLVLVDEAAAIPVYVLEQLVTHYHRMVFASTVHGYEGAGRGFTLKFLQQLDHICPQWRHLHLHQPIRYSEKDPLEQLIFDACLLNAELADISAALPQSQLEFKHISANVLVKDEALLAQIVSVLVTAHYQTKPSDIKMLLDNPKVELVYLQRVVKQKCIVVAVAMLMHEGYCAIDPVNNSDITEIKHSKKRLSNHFTPQSLLTQCGVEQAFNYHYLRVMRIAVHVQLQQQGIGSYLLTHIMQFAQQQGADFVSSSFGATKPLLSFWLKQNFHMARLGFSKDKASGEHSALVLQAVNADAEGFEKTLKEDFYRRFDYLLSDEYQHVCASLIALILYYSPSTSLTEVTAQDRATIKAFIAGDRQYACSVFSLYLGLKQRLVKTQFAEQEAIAVLINRIMQRHSIAEVCQKYHFTGKKELEQALRVKIKSLGIEN